MKRSKKVTLILVAIVALPILGLFVLSWTAKRPTNLGVTNGQLAPCPDKPNCVSTQAERDSQRMDTIPFFGDLADARARLKQVIASMPRTKIVEETDTYLRVEFTTAFFRFVDDAEFLFDESQQVIHFRSAARVGHSDMGKNRTRMMELRTAFARGEE